MARLSAKGLSAPPPPEPKLPKKPWPPQQDTSSGSEEGRAESSRPSEDDSAAADAASGKKALGAALAAASKATRPDLVLERPAALAQGGHRGPDAGLRDERMASSAQALSSLPEELRGTMREQRMDRENRNLLRSVSLREGRNHSVGARAKAEARAQQQEVDDKKQRCLEREMFKRNRAAAEVEALQGAIAAKEAEIANTRQARASQRQGQEQGQGQKQWKQHPTDAHSPVAVAAGSRAPFGGGGRRSSGAGGGDAAPLRAAAAELAKGKEEKRSGRLDAAGGHFSAAVEILRHLQGDGGAETGKALYFLAGVHRKQGRLGEAIAGYEEALAALTARLGPGHPATANVANDLGVALYADGDPRAALPHFERALGLRAAQRGDDHPDTKASSANVATCRAAIAGKKHRSTTGAQQGPPPPPPPQDQQSLRHHHHGGGGNGGGKTAAGRASGLGQTSGRRSVSQGDEQHGEPCLLSFEQRPAGGSKF